MEQAAEKPSLPDQTFEEISAFGSEAWIAARLGRSRSWLRSNRAALHAVGFPRPDPLVGLTLKDDVAAWLMRRRRIADPVPSSGPSAWPAGGNGEDLSKL